MDRTEDIANFGCILEAGSLRTEATRRGYVEAVAEFKVDAKVEKLIVETNVAATAAGPAGPPGLNGDSAEVFNQIRLLEEAMEDRFAMAQTQIDSMAGGCPCVDGRCPCACNRSAPLRDPPKATHPKASAGERDEFEEEGKDPWRAFRGKKKPYEHLDPCDLGK